MDKLRAVDVLFLLLLSLSFVDALKTVHADNIGSDEKNALQEFYNDAQGSTWVNKWNFSDTPCTDLPWYGLTCLDGRVVSLNLEKNGLGGVISPFIGNLTGMTELTLSHNRLYGSIPEEVGNLVELHTLAVDDNIMKESLPMSFRKLTKMQNLFLQHNLFSGPLDPLDAMPLLKYFYITKNKFTGPIPASMAHYKYLEQAGFDENMLTGTVSAAWGEEQYYLDSLWLQYNYFDGILPDGVCKANNCGAQNNQFKCPLPNPTCCGVTTCVP